MQVEMFVMPSQGFQTNEIGARKVSRFNAEGNLKSERNASVRKISRYTNLADFTTLSRFKYNIDECKSNRYKYTKDQYIKYTFNIGHF